jgi:hypothetical protein
VDEERHDDRPDPDEQRLHVAAVVRIEHEVVEEATAEGEADQQQHQRDHAEGLHRPVHVVGAQDHRSVAPNVLGNRSEQA